MEVAKVAASIDAVSGGRLLLGVGAGWYPEEFEALGWDFATVRCDEAIDVLRACWTGAPPSFEGRFFTLPEGLVCQPRPGTDVGVPILVGGMSRRALGRAVTRGDGWLAHATLAELDVGAVSDMLAWVRAERSPERGPLRATLRLVGVIAVDTLPRMLPVCASSPSPGSTTSRSTHRVGGHRRGAAGTECDRRGHQMSVSPVDVVPDRVPRWERVRERLDAEGFAGAFVTAGATFSWLCGFSPYPGGWPDFASCLLLPVGGDPVMLISAMHAEILDRNRCSVDRVMTYVDGEDPAPVLREAFAATGLERAQLAVEHHLWMGDVVLARASAPQATLTWSRLFEGVRAVKDATELALLRRSAACQDAAFATAAEVMRGGGDLGEAEIAIRAAMLAEGCETIKLLGVFRSRRPRRFAAGELIDIDFGTAVCDGYTIDSSRNVFFGEPDARLRDRWQVVVEAYDAIGAVLRPGVTAGEVHRAGAAVIEAAGERQTWKMGHGVGLSDGHEAPWLQDGSTTVLEPNMAFTIDPGFFVGHDLPLHLEDTVVVTEDGWECLNRFPREIIAV